MQLKLITSIILLILTCLALACPAMAQEQYSLASTDSQSIDAFGSSPTNLSISNIGTDRGDQFSFWDGLAAAGAAFAVWDLCTDDFHIHSHAQSMDAAPAPEPGSLMLLASLLVIGATVIVIRQRR